MMLTKPLSGGDHRLTLLGWEGRELVATPQYAELPLEDIRAAAAAMQPPAEVTGVESHSANLEFLGQPEGPQVAYARVRAPSSLTAACKQLGTRKWMSEQTNSCDYLLLRQKKEIWNEQPREFLILHCGVHLTIASLLQQLVDPTVGKQPYLVLQ